MDVSEEMSPKEMLEKIAELLYSQSQLRELNTEMRHWLDAADDEMAMLRSDNTTLRKQAKVLEKIISEAQQVEAESCKTFLDSDSSVKRCSEQKIRKLEEEFAKMVEQTKKLTAELSSAQQEREQDKISLSKLKVALRTLEFAMEEVQLELQQRDDVIHQKNLQLKHSEETKEECCNIIKDLRIINQELKKQLEDRQEEATLSALNDLKGHKKGSLSSPLSFAEEVMLLASSAEVKTSMSDKYLQDGETEAEELLKAQSLTVDLRTKRCTGTLEAAFQKAGLFIRCILIFTLLAFVASRGFARNCDFFSINTLWANARLMLQPYCSVHYSTSPPV